MERSLVYIARESGDVVLRLKPDVLEWFVDTRVVVAPGESAFGLTHDQYLEVGPGAAWIVQQSGAPARIERAEEDDLQ